MFKDNNITLKTLWFGPRVLSQTKQPTATTTQHCGPTLKKYFTLFTIYTVKLFNYKLSDNYDSRLQRYAYFKKLLAP